MAETWGKDVDLLKPIIQRGGSDSASLDNAIEALMMSGRDILHSMTMLVPPAWRPTREWLRNLRRTTSITGVSLNRGMVRRDWCSAMESLSRPVWIETDFDLQDTRLPKTGLVSLGSEVGCNDIDDSESHREGPTGARRDDRRRYSRGQTCCEMPK